MINQDSKGYLNIILTIVGILFILTWLRYTQALMVPFLLSIFIAIIIAGPIDWFKKKGLPVSLAASLTVLLVVAFIGLFVMMLGSSAEQFSNNLPTYQAQLQELMKGAIDWFALYGINMTESKMSTALDPGTIMRLVNNLIGSFSAVFSQMFLIILTVLFMLMEAWSIPNKIEKIYGDRGPAITEKMTKVVKNIRGYMSIKALMSLTTGFFITVGLAIVGLDFAILWGSLAFALNFIPNIGSIIAAVPAILFSLIQLGLMKTAIVMMIYVVVNVVIGNFIEPKYIGSKVGLSILVVFLSLVFWGWVLGPIGMILSVPLTMLIQFAALTSDRTRWLAVMLGPKIKSIEVNEENNIGEENER